MSNRVRPTRDALVFIIAALTITMGGVLVLYGLTDPANRPDLLTRIGTIWPMVVMTIPVILNWLNGREINAKADDAATKANHAANTAERVESKVDEIAESVNGRMSELIQQNGGAAQHDRYGPK